VGGWKTQKTVGVRLDPGTVKEAITVFTGVIDDFNEFLAARGADPVRALRPVGSVSYVDQDFVSEPDRVYGDIDYLVSFPCDSSTTEDAGELRRIENATKRKYEGHWVDFLTSHRPFVVDVDDTVRSTPLLTVIRLPDGRHVQVDIIITFPRYQEWMGGRYTPERRRKGLIMGHLYKSLGDVLVLSIGTEGVIARVRDGARVPSRFRKGVSLTSVSIDIQNFLVDIARYLVGTDDLRIHPLLERYPGTDRNDVSVFNLARGILGLGHTLAEHGIVGSGEEFSSEVADRYVVNARGELSNAKYRKASTPAQFAAIEKVRKQVESGIRDVDSILRCDPRSGVVSCGRILTPGDEDGQDGTASP